MTKNYIDMKIKDINEYYRIMGGNKRDLFWNRKYMIDEQLGRYNSLWRKDYQIKLEFYFKDDQKANKETLSSLSKIKNNIEKENNKEIYKNPNEDQVMK